MRGLSALHDAHPHDRAKRTAVHPVVRIDRESRRKALCVNEHFTRRIVEMSARYRWTAGTIGMWDNRFTQHDVVNDFVGERVIERVTIMGDLVMAPSRAGALGRKWSAELRP